MSSIAASELLAWALIAGGFGYWLVTWLGRQPRVAIIGATLAALATKSVLLDLS